MTNSTSPGRLGQLLTLAASSMLCGCTLLEPARPAADLGQFRLLGNSATSISSGRPAAQKLPPIDRGSDERNRTTYIEKGTGEYVSSPQRNQVEIDNKANTVSLNFVDVELQEFVRVVFDEILQETVIVDPALKGRITLRTSMPVSRASALDLVRQALQASGASLTNSGKNYRVAARSDQKINGRRLGDSISIVPVHYISTEEAKAALAPFAHSGTEINAAPNGRFLTISGGAAELDDLEQVLATLDLDELKGMSFGLFPLREAGAPAVASELTQVLGHKGNTRAFRSLPITRINAVLVIAAQPSRLAEARKWISRLDRADRDGRKIYVYPVQNRRATDIAKVLSAMLGTARKDRPETRESPIAPVLTPQSGASASRSTATPPLTIPSRTATPDPDPNTDYEDVTSASAAAKPQGPRINADPATNSLVVSANADEWRVIEAALRRLDIMPPQVLIEATIAEVRLTDSLKHGIRWYLGSGNHTIAMTGSDGAAPSSVLSPGFNYAFGVPSARAVLNALEQVTDVEIISSPALTVLDNQVARLQVGDQVPVATRAAQSVVNPDAPLVNDIELKDTGIILTVTPRVNASGLVMLDIAQEVSDVVPTTSSSLNSPTIRQRRIGSSVAVRSGMEIVLGGLISTSRTKTNNGIPGLMKIPLVGDLFKSDAAIDQGRTELLVILRPTVLGTGSDIRNVTAEIKSRLSGFKTIDYR